MQRRRCRGPPRCFVLLAATCLLLLRVHAELCSFEDGSSGVSIISELPDLTVFQQNEIRDHVLANALLPSQKTSAGEETILFDTPTFNIDAAVEFVAQTTGSTNTPVTAVEVGSSPCQAYSPELCFKYTQVDHVVTVVYETSWSGTCLGGMRDAIVTACLHAEDRDATDPDSAPLARFKCVVEDPIEDGPEASTFIGRLTHWQLAALSRFSPRSC